MIKRKGGRPEYGVCDNTIETKEYRGLSVRVLDPKLDLCRLLNKDSARHGVRALKNTYAFNMIDKYIRMSTSRHKDVSAMSQVCHKFDQA